MAFCILVLILSISSLLVHTPVAGAREIKPPLQIPEQPNFGILESPPALAPTTSPVTALIGGANAPPFRQDGEWEQGQQQQLEATVNDREQEQEQQQLQPTGAMEQGQDQHHHHQQQQEEDTDHLQPIGILGEQGQDQQQQQAMQGGVGTGAEPLVDNTPFDSGSSTIRRGGQYCTWFTSTLALIWLMI